MDRYHATPRWDVRRLAAILDTDLFSPLRRMTARRWPL
jgi:hypothetical protein